MNRVLTSPSQRINKAAASATAQLWTGATVLNTLTITVAGTAAVTFYDNVAGDNTGDIVGVLPATTSAGQIYPFNCPVFNGLSAVAGANTPGYVLSHTPQTT